MSLKDFHSDVSDLSEEDRDSIASSSYLQELNTLKIDKLSNRVTIISVMLPVFIGVVLFFIYLDIKDQVVDADISKNNQVEQLLRQSEEKLNALDVRIAKNRFALDDKMPILEKKLHSLENQTAKLIASKVDAKEMDTSIERVDAALARHDQRIQNNANQDKANVAQMERINASLQSTLRTYQEELEKIQRGLEEKIFALAETMEAGMVELQTLQKNISLLDKKIKDVENQVLTRKELARRFADLEAALDRAVTDLEQKITSPALSPLPSGDDQTKKKRNGTADTPPEPLLDTESPASDTISEDTLNQ
ncbi:MAG: hypothetical protein R6V15_08700 [Desulfotignum sp.]